MSRCLSVIYGVRAMVAPNAGSTDAMLAQVDSLLRADGYLREGDLIVFVAGQPVSRTGTMNLMKIHRLGDVS